MATRVADGLLKKPPKNGKFYIMAIDGRGGAGKTVLAEYLATLLPDFIFINGDDYFEPTPNAIAWGDFNDQRFDQDVIKPLRNSQSTFTYKPYDWHKEPHITEKQVTIHRGICIERSFSFGFDLDWDLKVWIEIPSHVSFKRGLERDKMPLEQATKAWEEIWQPREDKYIQDTKPAQIADIVIDGTKPFEDQLV